MAEHSSLTGASLHEPKGAAGASTGQVYVADGAGSGSFTTISNLNRITVTAIIPDISTASSSWVAPGVDGTITNIYSVINGAIGTGDTTLSFEIAGIPITSGNITITQSGSAAGDVDSSIPSAANVITTNQPLELITNGASTNTVQATITLVIDIS